MKRLTNTTLAKCLVGCLGILLVGGVMYVMPLGRELTVIMLGKTGSVAVPVLRRALQDDDHNVQAAAIEALKKIGAGAVPSLRRALTDKDARVRAQAAEALGFLEGDGREALPALVAAFNDSDDGVRVKAMGAVRRIGNDYVDALPALLVILRDDPSGRVRASAAEAVGVLGRLKPKLVTPALIQSLKDQDAEVRQESAESLGRLARNRVMPEEAIPALKEALKDPNKEVRDEAAEALSAARISEKSSADKD
jgi:HEAT repeat protein